MKKPTPTPTPTVAISIAPHLAEYALSRYPSGRGDGSVLFPVRTNLRHLLIESMTKHTRAAVDEGNLLVVLPYALDDDGTQKNPFSYCYLTVEGMQRIGQALRREFNYVFLTVMMDNELRGRPEQHTRLVSQFLKRYHIESLSEDALVKKFQRYRRMVCPKKVRKYEKRHRFNKH